MLSAYCIITLFGSVRAIHAALKGELFMAQFTTGSSLGLTKMQFLAADLLTKGYTEDKVKMIVFKVTEDSPLNERMKAARTLHKWMKDPKFIEGYRALMREFAFSAVGTSIKRLMKQVDIEDDKWGFLSNKAANDLLNRYWAVVMGEDDKQIVVKVEGMPDLGTPDADD